MIQSFKYRGLRLFFVNGSLRGIPASYSGKITRLLDSLDAALLPEDMNVIGFRFHGLKGAKKGIYSVSVSGNWRITFKFDVNGPFDIDLEDYH
jgi:proteic killer suppression protein